MDQVTTIKKMLLGNQIFVPTYQRAYSWDKEQIEQFLKDLNSQHTNQVQSKYYFGHFLFEEESAGERYGIVDGQQRITTIIIFLSALFRKLKEIREWTEEENQTYEDIIKRGTKYQFETVEYDKQVFQDYVIDQKEDTPAKNTASQKRIVDAFDYFKGELKSKKESYLLEILKIIQDATCTTHIVEDKSQAIQMFIFENDRGREPSNLERIKAQFMYQVHLSAGERKEELINELKKHFENIYQSISAIEPNIDEDKVLLYVGRVHERKSLKLKKDDVIARINTKLSQKEPEETIAFIQNFTELLADSFEHLKKFYGEDQRENIAIHSLITLGKISIVMPFIIKAYLFSLRKDEINMLCCEFESILLRQRLIGTRADLAKRLETDDEGYKLFENFTEDNPGISKIIEHIKFMKTMPEEDAETSWYSYWHNSELEKALLEKNRERVIDSSTAKFVLWKYENYLKDSGQKGYGLMRFDEIKDPHLEHIAPQTENGEPEAGYGEYDENFRHECLNCLGNYLLISKSHNSSIGNKPFAVKLESYKDSNSLAQQREVVDMTQSSARASQNPKWTKKLIQQRNEKIIQFILDKL